MKQVLFCLLSIISVLSISAQELSIKKVETLSLDTYSSVHKRVDANEVPCAVLKVSCPIPDVTFEGNIVGNVAHEGSDYIVYMTSGSRKIRIKHTAFYTLDVNFKDYGIEKLQGLSTYRITIKTNNENKNKEAPNTVHTVDLGLSVKWSDCNVGATKPTEFGTYFAWGETTGCRNNNGKIIDAIMDGYSSTWNGATNENYIVGTSKSNYLSWDKYKWYTKNGWDKYTPSLKTTLDSEDDAATANWGENWRMPTRTEQDELRSKCYWVWTSNYQNTNIKGYIIYKAKSTSDKGVCIYPNTPASKIYSEADPHIFLPATGARTESEFKGVNSFAYYWSSSLYKELFRYAYTLYFDSEEVNFECIERTYGMPIRAVRK